MFLTTAQGLPTLRSAGPRTSSSPPSLQSERSSPLSLLSPGARGTLLSLGRGSSSRFVMSPLPVLAARGPLPAPSGSLRLPLALSPPRDASAGIGSVALYAAGVTLGSAREGRESRRRDTHVPGGVEVPRRFKNNMPWLPLPPCARVAWRLRSWFFGWCHLHSLRVAPQRMVRSLQYAPHRRWGGADLRQNGLQATRHRAIPVFSGVEVSRGYIGGISQLQFPRTSGSAFEAVSSPSGGATSTVNRSLSSTGSVPSGLTSAAVGEEASRSLPPNTL